MKKTNKKTLSEQFGKNLEWIANEKGISVKEIAEVLNVKESTVTNWFSGSNIPSTDNAMLLARYLGVSLDDLVDDEECGL